MVTSEMSLDELRKRMVDAQQGTVYARQQSNDPKTHAAADAKAKQTADDYSAAAMKSKKNEPNTGAAGSLLRNWMNTGALNGQKPGQ